MIASGAVIGKKGSADKKAVALGGYFSSGAFFFVGASLVERRNDGPRSGTRINICFTLTAADYGLSPVGAMAS
jgi:hypothetical protein